VHYYLVDSQQQAIALSEADFESRANYAGASGQFPDTQVINISTPEGEAAYRALQEDLYLAGTLDTRFDASLVRVHDLTAGPSLPANKARSEFVPSAVPTQATIYIAGSEAARQQLLYEADMAAAVEGSDNALPTIVVIDHSDPEALQLEQALTEDRLNGGIGANVVDRR
jgi:hypothetical protein